MTFYKVRNIGFALLFIIIIAVGLIPSMIIVKISDYNRGMSEEITFFESVIEVNKIVSEVKENFRLYAKDKENGFNKNNNIKLINRSVLIAQEFEKKNPAENKELINDFIKMAKRFKAAFVGYFHETEYDYSGASTFEMEQIAYDSLAEMEKALHLWMDMALNDIKSYREKMDKVIVNSHNSSVLVVFFGCIASFIIAFFTARALSRPLNDLVEGANKIAKGDFTYRIQGEDEDDIGKLITAFNNMSKEIDSNEKQIRAVNQQLRANEQQLRATNQQLVAGEEKLRLSEQLLKRKLEDLESFHKITVGRELKMIELKKEINSLLQALGRDLRYHIDDRKD